MAAPTPKLGSFKKSFLDRRDRVKLASSCNGGSNYGLIGYNNLSSKKDGNELFFRSLGAKLKIIWRKLKGVGVKAWQMGRSDTRKVVFSAKMDLTLTLISLLIFWKAPIKDLCQHSVWAILTVVVVFEFSIST